ncbi:MAG: glycosyltransferase [Eubacteriales bacterium]|nr:glycosyltransferase [Eubacteriales bacterium]
MEEKCKQEQPLISVIVPVYNAKSYLNRCVDSILCQSYRNIELLLVDDGSSDGSAELCDAYLTDDRVRVFHTINSGVSAARNFGMAQASGAYLTFVDADDFISADMVERLYHHLETQKADVSIGNLHHTFEDTMIVENKAETISVWDNEQTLQKFLQAKETSFFPVAKLIKKELLAEVRFNADYKLAEDALLLTELYLARTIKTVYTDRPVYAYYHHKNSATTTVNRNTVFDTIRVHAKIFQLVGQRFPRLKADLLTRRYWSYFVVLDKIIFDETHFKKEITEITKKLKKNAIKIMRDRSFSKGRKLSLGILFFSKTLYRRCVMLNNRHLR